MEKEPEVLYVDGWIALIVKPAGLMVEPDKHGHPNVQDWAKHQWGGTTWAVHRLDRPTSGLLVIARKKTACTRLMQQFEKRSDRQALRVPHGSGSPRRGVVLGRPAGKAPGRVSLGGGRRAGGTAGEPCADIVAVGARGGGRTLSRAATTKSARRRPTEMFLSSGIHFMEVPHGLKMESPCMRATCALHTRNLKSSWSSSITQTGTLRPKIEDLVAPETGNLPYF